MRCAMALLTMTLAVGGCTLMGTPPPPPRVEGPSEGARLVARADQLAHEGQGLAARDLYERVLREHRADPARARALYGLGRLQVDPVSALRDYRAAHASFGRLLAEYPRNPWESEARAWRAALADLFTREEEATKTREEATRVKEEAARIREEATKVKEEAARLKTDLERLKRIDLDLERRR